MFKIAAIGDIHDQWDEIDNQTLQALGVNLALFVGDFGNESVKVVRTVSELPIPKAVILGNHDAWYTATAWGRKKCPYDRNKEDWLEDQLDLLGETHVGYSKLDFPQLKLSVVGSRPFTWGGKEWKHNEILEKKYNIRNFQDSQAKITENALKTAYSTLIFLGHNGPSGLGNKAEDMCGRDWQPLGGDHGDPDLEAAIADAKRFKKQVSLVVFGHMHHRLRHTKERLRTRLIQDSTGTIYLNAANVPRIQEKEAQKTRHFSLISLDQGQISDVSSIWVGNDFQILEKENLFQLRESCLDLSIL